MGHVTINGTYYNHLSDFLFPYDVGYSYGSYSSPYGYGSYGYPCYGSYPYYGWNYSWPWYGYGSYGYPYYW